MTDIIEIGYKKYENLGERTINIIPLMFNLADLNIFEMGTPESIKKSVAQIEQLKSDLEKGDTFPPIVVVVDDELKFVTIADGFHRLKAYQEIGMKITKALYVKRID